MAVRLSAAERKDDVVDAAMVEFAERGFEGTSTEDIARRAGVSQPYLFRLFGTKRELFLAVVNRGFDRILEAFRRVSQENPGNPLQAMGDCYLEMLQEREQLLLQMQAYAACADPEVQTLVRRRFEELYEFVESVAGPWIDQVPDFFAHGMLLNVFAAMNMMDVIKERSEVWANRCLEMLA